MKGKISLYFTAENIAKVRSRVENPGEDFSKNIRAAIKSAVVEVVNKNILDTRSIMIRKFQAMGMTVKDAKQAAALANPLQAYWDIVVSENPIGKDEGEEETAETPDEMSAEALPCTPADDFED